MACWFGTNGAGEAFVFNDAGEVLVVPWIGGREDAIPQGRFPAFVRVSPMACSSSATTLRVGPGGGGRGRESD